MASKLVGTRQNRKRAEEDVKLLANRIALLKAEEKKVSAKDLIELVGLEKDRRHKEKGWRDHDSQREK